MPDDATPQPEILRLFEGHAVVDTKLSFAGTITHVYGKPARELRHGEVLVMLTVIEVDKIGFPRNDGGGLVRDQKVKALESFELTSQHVDRTKLLAQLRAEVRRDVALRATEDVPTDGLPTDDGDPAP